MISALSLFLVQVATVALPAPDALQSYNWCVYRLAEVRVDQPVDQAVQEALVGCEPGLLKAATKQVIRTASGSSAAHDRVADLLRRQVRVNALARLNLIRSFEK